MTMYRHPRLQRPDGFTMIELMIMVAILGVLVSVATVSYNHFVIKSTAVEGSVVIHEIARLESVYHASHQNYTDSFTNLGFGMTEALKYYTPDVRLGSATDKICYQVRAVPIAASSTDAWLLTRYRDGSVQVDRVPVKNLGVFATARYQGNVVPITSIQTLTSFQSSGASGNVGEASGNNEPEWSDGGGNTRCKECGRVVRHLD